MNKRILSWFWASLFVTLLVACSGEEFDYTPNIVEMGEVKVYVAKYFDNKKATITITLDDGSRGQYTYAALELGKRNIPATFFVNGSFIKPITCDEDDHLDSLCLMDLVQRGFEVSNHTWSHVNLTTISLDSAKTEIMRNDDAIERWTGIRPTTLSFPNNARTKQLIDIAMEKRVGVRTFEQGFGQTLRHSNYGDMKKWAQKTIAKKNWGVVMLHGIDRGYDHWDDPNELWWFFDYLTSMQEELWLATFHDAISYITERDNSRLGLFANEKGVVFASLTTPLNTNLYSHPLTLVVEENGKAKLVNILPNSTIPVYGAE